MKIKWGNLLAFLLIIAGVVGYFQWPNIKGLWDQKRTTSVPVSKDTVVFARDTWISGGIPELGIARSFHRDYKLDLQQAFYSNDTDRLAALGAGKAHISEMSWPALLYNLEKVEKGKWQNNIVVLGFIDYSRGGDGIVVQSGIKTVNELLNKRVGYLADGTGKYMVSFLLRMAGMRFEDVQGKPYDDEEKMVADFTAGKLDALAYWQPGINDVLKKVSGSKVLLSTADMPTLIPDVLIANRQFVADNSQKVDAFLKFWFTTVKYVQEHPDLAYSTWANALNTATYTDGGKQESIYGTDNTAATIQDIFAKEVRLVGFDENLKLMGVTQQSEIDAMTKFAVDNWNLVDSLNGPNVSQLVNNRPLVALKDDVTLKANAVDPKVAGTTVVQADKPKEFQKDADPTKLNEVAQMAIPNIEFTPDGTTVTPAGQKVIDEVVVPLLKQFPNFYLLIDGHTDVGGDPAVLQKLSLGRANSVKAELVKRGFPETQILVNGYGDSKPLFPNPKNDQEKAKNRRTEFRLLRDK